MPPTEVLLPRAGHRPPQILNISVGADIHRQSAIPIRNENGDNFLHGNSAAALGLRAQSNSATYIASRSSAPGQIPQTLSKWLSNRYP